MHHEKPMVISGDIAGQVFISHYQTGEIGSLIGEHINSVESIVMSRTLPICVSAGIDTNINIYDLNKLEIRSKVVPSEYGGYTKIQFSHFDTNILYTASTLGDFSLIDVRDSKIVKTFKGNAAAINDFVEVRE
jgi:WD40 repeat protein